MSSALSISPTTIKIDANMKRRLSCLAEARHRTAHSLLIEAVETYIKREEKREALWQEALQIWKEYEITGMYAAHKDADDWMKQLEKGQDKEPPQCHL